MANSTTMTIRVDKEIKQQAQEIFHDLGLDMTTAMNIFLRQAILCNGLPFEVRLKEPNEETMAAIMEVKKMKEDPSLGKTYTDADKMMEDLLADV